jgi:hypothetical protein
MSISRARLSAVLAVLTLSCAPASAQMNLNPEPITPRTDSLFTISGFVPQIANTPAKMKHLMSLPPDRLITRTRNGRTQYLYADPNICRCVYVGTPEAYRVYQNGGPDGYVGDEANKSSPQFRPRVLMGEMDQDPYIDSPEGPALDSYLDGNMP